jgi:3-hydroxybutyryl-CoA dehydrogenase
MEIKKVGVVGCGTMGSGLAIAAAQAGYEIIVSEASEELLKKGLASISLWFSKGVEKGKLTDKDKDKILSRIKGTIDLKDMGNCQIIIEAAFENLALKKEIFKKLDDVCIPETILASNTTCLSIIDIAGVTKRPEKVIGMHFFNPPQTMKLVEIVRSIAVSEETYETAIKFAKSLGKETITAKDICGFIVSRLVFAYSIEAMRILEEGIGTMEDIDKGAMLGLGFPMGPFALGDFSGLDTGLDVMKALYEEHKDKRFAPPIILKKYVAAGRLGRKVGKGWYDYKK